MYLQHITNDYNPHILRDQLLTSVKGINYMCLAIFRQKKLLRNTTISHTLWMIMHDDYIDKCLPMGIEILICHFPLILSLWQCNVNVCTRWRQSGAMYNWVLPKV